MSRRISALVAGWAVLAIAGCAGANPPPPTARVDRGDVISAVTGSGSVVPSSEQQLGFRDGGKLVQVLVRVGDRVEPGQVLARLDDFALRQTLAQRQATLDEPEAVVGRIRGNPTVGGAQASLDQAREIQGATEEQVEATEESNASATDRARAELKAEEAARAAAQNQLRVARSACSATRAGTPSAAGTSPTTCDTSSAESAVQQAESAVVQARTQVVAAEQQQSTDAAAGQVSIENARQGVISAQNELSSARAERPFNIVEQQAKRDDARAGVASVRRDVEQTVLTAPVTGVVAAINGVPGEFVPAPTGVTAQGPGGSALPPDPAGGTEASGSFLVLTGANAFQVVVPFEESDAVRLAVGQQVDIALPALETPTSSGPALTGRVLAIAPTGQDLDGVVVFYTTISIENPIPQLRNGQTAVASVRMQVAPNVLRVPNPAVGRTADGRPSVTITGPDGDPVTVPFEPALVGDDFTEVRSGLPPGQDVRLPQATITATNDSGPPN